MKPPFAYYGGKTLLARWIVAQLPAHEHYVEPFAGSLAVLLAKPPARMETVNDLDGDLMCFWRVLREHPHQLLRACALTPHARAEMLTARDRPDELPELERARRVWVLLSQARTGTLRNTGWRHFIDPTGSPSTAMPGYLRGYVDRLAAAAQRLQRVSLECRPALDLIATYGRHRRVLLYLDPPYLATTRGGSGYRHEMAHPDQHTALAAALHQCQATVVLSGYPSDLYDQQLYPDWYRREIRTGTGQAGQWGPRVEVLWSNRPLTDLPTTSTPPLDTDEFRNTQPDPDPPSNETTRCPGCGGVLRQPHTGRRRRHCSPACRVRAHRARTTPTPTADQQTEPKEAA